MRSLLILAAPAILMMACSPIPAPSVLADAVLARESPAAREAKDFAPQAYAHAEKLRLDADAAFRARDLAAAQILGERAIAAYAHADALARIARAEAISNKSQGELEASQAELARVAGDQTRVGAEVDALELRIRVEREAQSVVPSGPADPGREKARRAAGRSLGLEAHLLCTAAKLLIDALPGDGSQSASTDKSASSDATATPGPTASEPSPSARLKEAQAALGKLDAALDDKASATPIDQATRARAACLAVLTSVRRAATPVSKAPGAGDALLSELSAMGTLSPSRDDRGVVVTLRGVFSGEALGKEGETRLAELGRVAAAHPDFPVEIVLHQDKEGAKEQAASAARAAAAAKALQAAGAHRVDVTLAGTAAPIVDPGGDRARNARVEVVFVTPESL